MTTSNKHKQFWQFQTFPTKTIQIKTSEDLRALTFYTLCRLQETTHYADPIAGLPVAISRQEFKGVLTVDLAGNFVSFE